MNATLERWRNNGWLRPHTPTRGEIANLLAIVERDLSDARQGAVSSDWRFGIAYNAALKLCAVVLRSEGYRPEHSLSHYRTIAALPLILGESRRADAEYLETCRRKRNIVEYDRVGETSGAEVEELIEFADELARDVRAWLGSQRPDLLPRD
jgi:hypothetical protein